MAAPLLLHVFSTFGVGGAQVRFAALATAFGPRYRHVVTAMDGEFACASRLAPDLDLRCCPIEVTKGATLRNVRRFRQTLHDVAPDTLVTYNWGAIEWAVAGVSSAVRHVHVEDGFGPEERDRQLPRRVWTRRLVLRRSTVVVPSHTLWRIAMETWRLRASRVRYVPNGVELGRFVGPRTPGGEPVIGTVTGLRPEKNLGRLLHAFRRLLDAMPARLVVVGDGPERPQLERLAVALGIAGRVDFVGHVTDPAPLYRAFDVFALSSDTEQMPLSVIEAMASGLPVAATSVGDVASMVAPENARFVVAPDAAALGDALATLARDAELRGAIGVANRAKARAEFDAAAMQRAWAGVFDGDFASMRRGTTSGRRPESVKFTQS